MSTVFKMVFYMDNDKVLIQKLGVITPIPDSTIPVDLCQKNKCIINFTNDYMRFIFEVLTKTKYMHYI